MASPLLYQIQMGTNRQRAFTLTELLTTITIIGLLAALLLPVFATAKRKSSGAGCVNNLKQIDLAFKVWANDNGDQYPMVVPMATGGAKEFAAQGIAFRVFQVMSNELNRAVILHCPNDTNTPAVSGFANLNNRHVSYFIGADATEKNPDAILLGDDNLVVNGKPVWPALWELPMNTKVGWSAERHRYEGNIGLTDGSVHGAAALNLEQLKSEANPDKARLIIP